MNENEFSEADAEVERLLSMSDEQILAEVIRDGIDITDVVKQVDEILARAKTVCGIEGTPG